MLRDVDSADAFVFIVSSFGPVDIGAVTSTPVSQTLIEPLVEFGTPSLFGPSGKVGCSVVRHPADSVEPEAPRIMRAMLPVPFY